MFCATTMLIAWGKGV